MFYLHIQDILKRLELEDEELARLERALPPSIDTSGNQMISFVCTDKSEPPRDIEHHLDPWTFVEGYPDGQLPPAYFCGKTIERTNFRYIKSPFDPPSGQMNATMEQ